MNQGENAKTDIVQSGPLGAERMLKWFDYEHLPGRLIAASKMFHDVAITVVEQVQPGPERTVALRKLLEAKDACVRAVVRPGG